MAVRCAYYGLIAEPDPINFGYMQETTCSSLSPPRPTLCPFVSLPGNQTRYRVITSSEDTGGESFTIEMLIREGAYGSTRGEP